MNEKPRRNMAGTSKQNERWAKAISSKSKKKAWKPTRSGNRSIVGQSLGREGAPTVKPEGGTVRVAALQIPMMSPADSEMIAREYEMMSPG